MRAARLLALMSVRLRLLLRQRLGWGSLAGAVLAVVTALVAARMSWVNPGKVFWDFALGLCFASSAILALWLGSQLYHEERGRRTLHLVLAAGLSRREWVLGNGLALWVFLVVFQALWLGLSALLATSFDARFLSMATQAQLALMAESLVLVFLAVFLSLWVRPLLAFLAGVVLALFLHSSDALERIFTNKQYGHFVDVGSPAVALWISRLLPPLHWFDLRDFVGYEDGVGAGLLARLAALGILWGGVLAAGAIARFERMDL